jgi:polyphosphate kinase
MAGDGKKSDEGKANGKDKGKLRTKKYEKQLAKLHVELVRLQEWVKAKGTKVCIVFEGRDGAGKGGTIKAITERVSPRVFRVVALPSPTEREKSQMYRARICAVMLPSVVPTHSE